MTISSLPFKSVASMSLQSHTCNYRKAVNTQDFLHYSVRAQTDILHEMIALPFPQETWQDNKILTYLLIKVSNEITYFCETGLSKAILVRGTRALFVKLLQHHKLCMSFNIPVTVKSI